MIEQSKTTSNEPIKTKRGRIKSEFPKNTLQEAIRVAKAIEDANGGQPYPPTDTAIALGMSPGSSDFRTLLSSAIKYGLTQGSYNQDRVSLQQLGRDLVEPQSQEQIRSAMVSATLRPETFRRIYEHFRGKKLPKASYLQNTVMREFEVPKEHAEACVNIFNSNMDYVGLVRVATTGRWLSAEPIPLSVSDTKEEQITDEETYELPTTKVQDFQETPPKQPLAPSQQKNAIFIGHGKNKTPLQQLKTILDQFNIPYKIAISEPNEFRPISQKVAEIMDSCGAAILIFTADEEFRDSAGNTIWRPSENVIFELGASSVLYGRRVILFKEKDVTFPTNFRDIGYIEFEKDNLNAKVN